MPHGAALSVSNGAVRGSTLLLLFRITGRRRPSSGLQPLVYVVAVLPEDVHVLASGRLNVSVVQCSTRKPFLRSVYVNEFESKDDLVQALLTSSHVPLYMNTRVTSTFRGQTCVDGGLG